MQYGTARYATTRLFDHLNLTGLDLDWIWRQSRKAVMNSALGYPPFCLLKVLIVTAGLTLTRSLTDVNGHSHTKGYEQVWYKVKITHPDWKTVLFSLYLHLPLWVYVSCNQIDLLYLALIALVCMSVLTCRALATV